MDAYSFVKIMEERKEDLLERVKGLPRRDVVDRILREVEEFKKRGNNRIYIYYGLRGIGKTTAMLQAMESVDSGYIDGSLVEYYGIDPLEVIREYVKTGKKDVIFIDELTDIPRWGDVLKLAYDTKKIKIIATGSSAIKITTEKRKVSRRAVIEEIPPLTFREFLRIFKNKIVERVDARIFTSKSEDAYVKAKSELMRLPSLERHLKDYARSGFPLILEMKSMEIVSDQILSSIITKDIPSITGFNMDLVDTIEKAVYLLASSPPGTTSTTKISEVGNCSRTTASNILKSLEIASLIIGIPPSKTGAARLRKEKKYLFSSPSIRYGFLEKLGIPESNIGGLREDIFVSTATYLGCNVGYVVGSKKSPDYALSCNGKNQIIEVGGPSKTGRQLEKRGIILTDSDTLDYSNGIAWIPLYLFALTL